MFRSVFTKYITAFMLIISVSFIILALILFTMVSGWSENVKADTLNKSAEIIAEAIGDTFVDDEASDFNRFVYFRKGQFTQLLSSMAEYTEDVHLFVIDTSGAILVRDSASGTEYMDARFPLSLVSAIRENGIQEITGTLDGILPDNSLIVAYPMTDSNGALVGAAIAVSGANQISPLISSMIKTIILSCLWVMLAALVAVYFISKKIIEPLKEMSMAAKSFAAGKFDVRVPVRGRDEVAELATAFNNMAASISKLEDMRRTFLSSVSHDLRTPMTTISGFIDGILDGTIPPEKHEYYLDIIRTEVRRLARLVASLLDITRIQAGERKFNKTAFDICEMARLILISFEQKIDEKHLDVEFDCKRDNITVYADHDAIYQILYNICDNAVKFSREGGKYKISILEREKKVYISVFNEGVGIPPEELPFVFERFYKSDKSRGLDKTGVGLGLYIAKTIIDAHEEEIWVKSAHGENCEFVFTLPYTPEITVKD